MNWFKDMLMLFSEWVLLMIIPLLLGILIGWLIWGRKAKNAKKENEKLQVALDDCKAGKGTVRKTEVVEAKDDLTAVKGVDKDVEASLNSKGINSYKDLALLSNDDVDNLEKEFGFEDDRIRNENWVSQSAQLHFENYDEEIYDKVQVDAVYADAFERQLAESNKGVKLDYTDDLKIVSGVGPKMEKLLHEFGITTFYHLSKLDKDGVEALNEKLEFFPGRIERDDWVGQAEKLHKEHH